MISSFWHVYGKNVWLCFHFFFWFLLIAYSRVYGDSQTNLSVSQGHILYIGLFKQELLNCTQMVYWITGDLWYSLNNFTSCTSLLFYCSKPSSFYDFEPFTKQRICIYICHSEYSCSFKNKLKPCITGL